MAEAQSSAPLLKRPAKGILKGSKDRSTRPRFEDHSSQEDYTTGHEKEGVKWNEMNILTTLHPPGKDYGHMKINEPNTPYRYASSEDESEGEAKLLQKVHDRLTIDSDPEVVTRQNKSSDVQSDSEDDFTEEAIAQKKAFKDWRKKHYDEFHKVKAARALLGKVTQQEDDDEDEDDEEMADDRSPSKAEPSVGRMETDI